MSAFNHILFSAGGLTLAAPSNAVHCIHDGLVANAEADTVNWFSGVAVADGRLLPITDLGLFLKGGASTGRVIEVARNLGIVGLRIDEVHGVSRNRPDDDGASINDLGQRYRIVDIVQLVNSARFLNVHAESTDGELA